MRRISRRALPASAQKDLDSRQAQVDRKHTRGILDAVREWKKARRTKPLKTVETTLKAMTGRCERCMYCCDSHGTDIEHFWPKKTYPGRMFHWPNLLYCCTECGRLKGDRFETREGRPLLVDPTAEDPWVCLEFDPETGNLTARFDADADDWDERGSHTVEALRLDKREACAAGYRRTWERLKTIVARHLDGTPDGAVLAEELSAADDHGLLGWCLAGSGKGPFAELHRRHPCVWDACRQRCLWSS